MTLVERVKSIAQRKKGWNLKETAINAGLGVNSIYKWNKQSPSIKSMEAVANALGVTVDELKGSTSKNESNVLDPADQRVLALFRKQTENMSVEDKEDFNDSLEDIMSFTKELILKRKGKH